MNSSLIFLKCYFCHKSHNKNNLINIAGSSVIINDENIEFKNLIFDTCFIHIDDVKQNYICNECNNNLVLFHMFKRDAKKYKDFLSHIKILEVLSKLEKFLDAIDDLSNLVLIIEDSLKFCIQTDSQTDSSKDATTLKDEIIVYEPEEEVCEGTEPNEVIFDINNDNTETVSHLGDESVIKMSENECSKAKKRRLNTLSDLQPDQINWIRQQVSDSDISKGKKKQFQCSVCQVVLCTQASLVRHLRDLHILKDKSDERTILRTEVANSKLIIDTENGKETIWKCPRCVRERIYKSEQAFKLHFRMTHLRDTKIDSSFIANCKTTMDIENEGVKDVWKCPECEKIFRHRDGLRNHLKTIHPNNFNEFNNYEHAPNTSVCPKDIQDLPKLTEKLINKTISKGENFCNECGVKFLMAKHHVKPKTHRECHETFKTLAPLVPHYKCEKCRMVFNTEISLEEHLSTHDDHNSIQLIPADGLTSFGALYHKDAIGDVDESCLDEAVWKCGHCNVRYFEENDCVVHQMLLHSITLYCLIDNREFHGLIGLSKYLQHMKNKHPELFPHITYACSSCKMEFPTIYEKLDHQKSCDLKKYECDYCSKRYSTKHQLQAHILFELGISGYSCEICGKKCKTMSDLRIHQNIHTGLRPYKCSLCEKTFKTPAARSSHMEKHMDGVTCEICGTKLTNRTLYKRHKRFQHDLVFQNSQYEKNSCNICDKSFLRTSHFKQHMKQQHGIS